MFLVFLNIEDVRVIVESDFENFLGYIFFELGFFLVFFNRRWVKIICGFFEGKSVRKIFEEFGVFLVIISNELKEMIKYGFVKVEKFDGRVLRYKVINVGRFYLKIKGENCYED